MIDEQQAATEPTRAGYESAQPRARRSGFAGDVLKLMAGTAFSQLLTAVAALLLARMFLPEAFGVTALFVSIVTTVSVIAALRYELAIMLPEDDTDAAALLGTSLIAVTLVSLLTAFALWGWGAQLVTWLRSPTLLPYLWLAPPTIFFTGLYQVLNYWNSRTRHFGRLAVARVVQSSGTAATQLGMGVVGVSGSSSLIGGHVAGRVASALLLGGQIWRDDGRRLWAAFTVTQMWAGAKRYRKFPLYNTGASLLNTLSWQLPAFMLAIFFSPVVVGYYALGNRLVRLPMNIIGGSVSQVFYQRASDAHVQGNLARVVEETYIRLLKLSFFPLLVLSLTGGAIFAVLFGPEWREAGVYTQILAAWTCVWFISSPMATLYSVLERQEFSLGLNVVIFGSRLASLWIGGWVGNARLTLILFAVSGIVVYGYLSVAILLEAGVTRQAIIRPIVQQLVLFAPAGLLLVGMQMLDQPAWSVVVTSVLVVGIYYAVEGYRDPALKAMLLRRQMLKPEPQ